MHLIIISPLLFTKIPCSFYIPANLHFSFVSESGSNQPIQMLSIVPIDDVKSVVSDNGNVTRHFSHAVCFSLAYTFYSCICVVHAKVLPPKTHAHISNLGIHSLRTSKWFDLERAESFHYRISSAKEILTHTHVHTHTHTRRYIHTHGTE